VGVPNFFIDSFRIPPFLLPIFEAAGVEYGVPWQVLAAINEIETDYGRNLSVSSAGAVGWMQFLPSTWRVYGVDATGAGVADPYNPVDAVFAAARYLHAAGASRSLAGAIYSYNHAGWYVQSVLLRAKLIGGMPDRLIGALSGLVEGHFPVAARARYADDAVTRLARPRGANAAVPVGSDPGSTGTEIYARRGAPVIAVNDGRVVRVGRSARWGNFVELQDETGNVYTYAHLGSIPRSYPVPRPVSVTAAQIARQLSLPQPPAPRAPATAGSQQPPAAGDARATLPTTTTTTAAAGANTAGAGGGGAGGAGGGGVVALVKERLFADPARAGSYAAGGALQLKRAGSAQRALSSFQDYFSDVLHLGRDQYTLAPLRAGAVLVAGTILGRIAAPDARSASHVTFMIRPAGRGAPYIDPKPILDGWKLLEASAVYRAAGIDPFIAKDPTIGQILLMSKEQLQRRVLADPRLQIYKCGRRDVQAGLVDRRILALLEFLSASSLDPTVSGLVCGHNLTASTGVDPAGATGASVDISKINNIPIQGHQTPGSITDITIRRLLTLQGTFKPDQIISHISYKAQPTTLALPDHQNRIQITYTPQYGQNKKLSAEIKTILQPGQWIQLINRISQIPEPIVPITPSKYAIKTTTTG
jgi:Transglycosylase SLT domain/Peptidase family M23